MKKNHKKLLIIFSIAIAVFVIGIVFKTLQNDTFFNIAIGKQILKDGIDMKEHFCWVDDNLDYTHSHWIFDIIMYIIYNSFNFDGIYIFTILFTIIIGITLFVLLTKRNQSPVVAFVITLISLYIIRDAFTARSQIISFLCFIIEIYCLEKFIETNRKKYAFIIAIQSIIVANFHAATWPLELVLFCPYLAAGLLNKCSVKNIYRICIKKIEKNIKKLPKDSPKIEQYAQDIKDYEKIIQEPKRKYVDYKVVRRENYNLKNLIILFLIISLTGLITPLHGTPYTYIIKSMFGTSNFGSINSIDFIHEMQPLTPLLHLGFIIFSIILIAFLAFVPTKLKTEHVFLIVGLVFMALSSGRYSYLLVLLGAFVLSDLLTQAVKVLISEDIKIMEELFSNTLSACVLIFLISIYSGNMVLSNLKYDYIDKVKYPVYAVEYIKNNLDYKNMRIYNSYDNGSYLMLNDIPVFIDSRLDVYCSEFNDTDIFYDFIQITYGYKHYEEIFKKYDITHVLLEKDDIPNQYMSKDYNYKLLHEDEYYVLYEKLN